ncbi:MAG: hypothetical protein GC150_09900 [Rhizobiales bacterium]|nr:hypothetical protein [Hyphomicrobiales bacterium]
MPQSTTPGQFIRAMTVLQVASLEASIAFYGEKLGFVSHGIWSERADAPGDFAIVQRGPVTLALDRSRAGPVPVNQWWAAYVYVADADALYRELKNDGVIIHREIGDMPYGMRDFDVRDPDGHIIAFGSDLSPTPPGPGLAPDGGRDGPQ